MSENTTFAPVENVEEIDTDIQAKREAEELISGLDMSAQMILEKYNSLISTANEITEKIRQATGGDKEQIAHLLNTDPDFAEYRAEMAKFEQIRQSIQTKESELIASAKKQAKEKLPEVAGLDIEEAKTARAELRKQVTGMKTAAIVFVGEDVFNAYQLVNGVGELIGNGRNNGPSGAGAKRYRFESIVVDGKDYSTLTEVASGTGIPQEVLRKALVTAAGTEDLKSLAGREITVPVTHENKTVTVVAVPK